MTEFNKSLEETLTLTSQLIPLLYKGKSLGETLGLADSVIHSATYRRRLADVLSLTDLGTTRRVDWNRALGELLSNPDEVIAVRDAWNVIKRAIVPEMYTLENWAKVFEFLELFGHEYNRALGFIDSLPRLTGVRTGPAHLVPNLVRLIGLVVDPRRTLAEQQTELEQTTDVYKQMGRTVILERSVFLIEPTANPSIDFPDDEVLRWSDSPPGGWSNGAIWGDRLQYNHHVARLSIAVSIPNIELLIDGFIPAGVHLIINIADSIIEEVPFDVGSFGGGPSEEELDGVLEDPFGGLGDTAPYINSPDTLYMGDITWFMGDSDKFLSDEANVNRQPFDSFLEN